MTPKAKALHKLDRHLCGLIGGELQVQMEHQPFAEWLIPQLPPGVAAWMQTDTGPPVLLNESELAIVEYWCLPVRLLRPWQLPVRDWADHRPAVGEVRRHLSLTAADNFDAYCGRARDYLEGKPHLEDGLNQVVAWIREVRQLIRSIGEVELLPRPEGLWPTPTSGHAGAADPGKLLGVDSKSAQPEPQHEPAPFTVFDPEQVGGLLQISSTQVIRLIEAGRLNATNVGMGDQKPRYRVTREELRRFLLQDEDGDKAGNKESPQPSASGARRSPKPPEVDYFA